MTAIVDTHRMAETGTGSVRSMGGDGAAGNRQKGSRMTNLTLLADRIEAATGRMKRGDDKLLRRVLDSNGGGVIFWDGYLEYVPVAQQRRLLNLGLVRPKPNHSGFYIHTELTAAALRSRTLTEGR